jgi:hypothetical protein
MVAWVARGDVCPFGVGTVLCKQIHTFTFDAEVGMELPPPSMTCLSVIQVWRRVFHLVPETRPWQNQSNHPWCRSRFVLPPLTERL